MDVFEQLKEEDLFSFGTRNQEEQADQTRICKELFFCSGKLLECFFFNIIPSSGSGCAIKVLGFQSQLSRDSHMKKRVSGPYQVRLPKKQ